MGARATTTNLALANVKNAGKLRTLLEKLSLNDKEEGQHLVEEEEKEEEDQQEEGEGARVSNPVSRALRNGSEENLGSSSIHVLPNDILTLIFARLPRATLSAIRLTCSTWKRLCQHQDIAVLRRQVSKKKLGKTPKLCIASSVSELHEFPLQLCCFFFLSLFVGLCGAFLF
jgi:hypothetical protein